MENAIKKSSFTKTQIIKILKEVDGGRQVKEVCRDRDLRISNAP